LVGGGIGGLIPRGVGWSLTVTNSAFTGNSGVGGGIGSSGESLTVVTNSTFTGNNSNIPPIGGGGGIGSFGGSLMVTNSTFAGNSGSVDSSGDSRTAGGIGVGTEVTSLLRNTIFANNTPGDNCSGVVTDGGHNLDDGTSCGFSAATGSLNGTDPRLDPAGLRDNGGPTHTVALCTAVDVPAGCSAASPAIDAGDQAVCSAAPVNGLDQRGSARPGAGHTNCSIGAYEADITPEATPTPTATPTFAATPTRTPTIGACSGDCNGNGQVLVDELVTLVSIALGNAPPAACPHGVASGAAVNVALLVRAVNSALAGC
jgi:hypothetical protein